MHVISYVNKAHRCSLVANLFQQRASNQVINNHFIINDTELNSVICNYINYI